MGTLFEVNELLEKPHSHNIFLSFFGGACGVMVIVIGNGYDDTSSNPGQDWLHFT